MIEKLHPKHFPQISGKMAAIALYLIGSHGEIEPEISGLTVTSDGVVLAEHVGEVGANDVIGSFEDLDRNWRGYCEAAELNEDEAHEAELLIKKKVTFWGTALDLQREPDSLVPS